jgi:DNA-directed RNA polymerase beta subunit
LGILVPPENLPFSCPSPGNPTIIPDIVFNPHGYPSRMTIGMILETMAGKLGAITGKRYDATAFEDCEEEISTQEKLEKALMALGFSPNGNQRFCSGTTGEMLRSTSFVGLVHYQRLKHMVDEKLHARSRGPVHILTRQPIDGRARDGGLRFGEMERDCVISYGAASALNMRMLKLSDECEVFICGGCGNYAYKNGQTKSYHCTKCTNPKMIKRMKAPFAFKLLNQELISMGIMPRFNVQDCTSKEEFETLDINLN